MNADAATLYVADKRSDADAATIYVTDETYQVSPDPPTDLMRPHDHTGQFIVVCGSPARRLN
jgi:hypothetical protein